MKPALVFIQTALLCALGGILPAAEYVDIGPELTAFSLSADGRVVVGSTPRDDPEAYIWSRESGLRMLGTLPGHFESEARDVSGDGSTVVGWSERFVPVAVGRIIVYDPFLWREGDGMVELSPLPGFDTLGGISISEDASTVVGSFFGDSYSRGSAFRWTAVDEIEGMMPPGMNYSFATAVSADGGVIVGSARADLNPTDGFIWDEQNGFQNLGPKPPGWEIANPWVLSADGNVVFGKDSCSGCSFGRAFRWTAEDGVQPIPGTSESSTWYVLQDVTPDGSIVVGSTWEVGKSETIRASIWDEQHGTRDLRELLISQHGFADEDLPTLFIATGISADAKTIVGSSVASENRGGWAIYLDRPLVTFRLDGDYNSNGIVDAADYVVWRNGLGTTYTQTDYAVWRANFGATAAGAAAVAEAAVNAAVPETTALLLAGLALFVCQMPGPFTVVFRRRRLPSPTNNHQPAA